jgi:DNA polymerase elongation subunit (family B)
MQKILLLDIETAPITAKIWRLDAQYVSTNQIIEDSHLLSYAAKFLNEKKIFYNDQKNIKDKTDDKKLLLELKELLNEADVVVAHNGKAFDIPFILGRMFLKNIDPPSHFEQIDTYRLLKSKFALTSNKLEYVAKYFKLEKYKHKKFSGIELWLECLKDNKKAFKELKKYNIQDVIILEKIYLMLRKFIDSKLYVEDENQCPHCLSKNTLQKNGIRYTKYNVYQRYICTKCFGWSRGKIALNNKKINIMKKTI